MALNHITSSNNAGLLQLRQCFLSTAFPYACHIQQSTNKQCTSTKAILYSIFVHQSYHCASILSIYLCIYVLHYFMVEAICFILYYIKHYFDVSFIKCYIYCKYCFFIKYETNKPENWIANSTCLGKRIGNRKTA